METPSSDSSSQTDSIDVSYVADLARLTLSEKERALFQGQLSDVIHYIKLLEKVDVSHVPDIPHNLLQSSSSPEGADTVFENNLRKDEERPSLAREAVMENAPEKSDGLFIMPKIVE